MANIECLVQGDSTEAVVVLSLTVNEAKLAISTWDTTLEFKHTLAEAIKIASNFNKGNQQ